MNRKLKYPVLLTVCMLTLASPTCEDEVSPDGIRQAEREALQAVADDFRSESLTARNLDAFEYRAVEKLFDYADYLNIVYDQDLDETFHNQARENIKDLFVHRSPPADPLPGWIDPRSYSSIRFLIDSIEIIAPLEREPTEIYRGGLQYSQKIIGITRSDSLILDISIQQMEMLLQMKLKDFGENSLLVWEVLLNDQK
jgi:hypothetical protein